MEDNVVGGLRKGPVRDLFDQACVVTNYPGSANNWYWSLDHSGWYAALLLGKGNIADTFCRAVGYHTYGIEYQEKLEDTIRHMVEKCSRLHGFLLMHSVGGGTGSGLGTAVLKLLADNYPTIDRY